MLKKILLSLGLGLSLNTSAFAELSFPGFSHACTTQAGVEYTVSVGMLMHEQPTAYVTDAVGNFYRLEHLEWDMEFRGGNLSVFSDLKNNIQMACEGPLAQPF